jgi:hypothetical protein
MYKLFSAKEAADKACTTAVILTSTAAFVIAAFIIGIGIVLAAKKAQIW